MDTLLLCWYSIFPPPPILSPLTDSVKQNGGRVLVHCQAGISRSATICLAYLMHTQRVKLDEAFDFVKQRRQVISPNLAFMGQLLQFETDVLCRGWKSGNVWIAATVQALALLSCLTRGSGRSHWLHKCVAAQKKCISEAHTSGS